MKKLFFAVIIFFLSITSSYATFFINGEGNYMSTGDFIPVTGFGYGIGFSLNDNVNFIMNGSYALATEKDDDPINKKKYKYSIIPAELSIYHLWIYLRDIEFTGKIH